MTLSRTNFREELENRIYLGRSDKLDGYIGGVMPSLPTKRRAVE
jgi:hypothetical protein